MAGLSQANVEWDVFISHASEDKDDFVRPLAHGLEEKGLKVWFDEFTLRDPSRTSAVTQPNMPEATRVAKALV
jgi:TIR domain